jgi:transposase-like protein
MTSSETWQPSDIQAQAGDTEAEAKRRRGRIPQSAWPRIVEMHKAGSTLSAIAREFDCTPSAISYIVRKAEAQGTDPVAEEAEASHAEAPPSAPAAPAAAAATPAAPAAPAADAPPPTPGRLTGQITLRSVSGGEPRQPVAAQRPVEPPARPAQPAAVPPPAPAAGAQAASAPAGEAPRPAGARAEPAPVDEVEGRLRETARAALVAYRAWRSQPVEASAQTLSDAVHDLRKALSRIEIDLAASRRDQQAARPIPIPWHRAARRGTGGAG